MTRSRRPGAGRFRLPGPLFAVLLLLASPAVAGDDPLPFLSVIELAPIKGASGGRFEVRLYHKDPGVLASSLAKDRSYTVLESTDHVAVISDRYSFPRTAGGSDVRPTFIADHDLEVFQRIRKEVTSAHGARPGATDLVAFVNAYIKKKNYTRGFDVASRVVERREGDCSEHAVLLVSLLRLFGFPAKMVFGLKLMATGDGSGAFGHAWVEYLHQGTWKAADPTLAMPVDRSYIPFGTLENEGMDYAMELVTLLQKMPYRVEASGL